MVEVLLAIAIIYFFFNMDKINESIKNIEE